MEPKTENLINVYHLIVLDESGSMGGVTEQTISGCNETLHTIKDMQEKSAQTQNHYVSIYCFDHTKSRYIIQNKPIAQVNDITERDYSPCGLTPLFDALGLTLTNLIQILKDTTKLGYVTIITDGYENASHEYGINDIIALIDQLKKMNVVFSFIGANIDAEAYSKSLHIENHMQFEQTREGMERMWSRERQSKMRSQRKSAFLRSIGEFDGFAENENLGNYYEERDFAGRVTFDRIHSLAPNEIFVFGSNIYGSHDGGAALTAVRRFGARVGQAEGLQGQSYAIPTVGLTYKEIYMAVKRFTEFAANHSELTFLVTAIGCGHGGYTPEQMSPMFEQASRLPNVKLPKDFCDML